MKVLGKPFNWYCQEAGKLYQLLAEMKPSDWYPKYMIGKLQKKQGFDPTLFLETFRQAMDLSRLKKTTSKSKKQFDRVEPFYRFHASRAKILLFLFQQESDQGVRDIISLPSLAPSLSLVWFPSFPLLSFRTSANTSGKKTDGVFEEKCL